VTWLIVILGLGLLIFLHELGHFPVARLVGMKPRAFYIGFGPALVKVRREGIEYAAIPLGGYVRIPGMQRPAAPDFETAMSPGLREDPALGSVAEAVQQPLVGGDFEAARAAVPALSTALEQAQLTPAARRPAEQAVRDVDERSGADAYWRQPTWKRLAAIAAGPGMNVLVAFVIFFAVYATGAPSQNPSTEVAQVQANTPAAAAGLHPGDRIVAVDGRSTHTFSQVSKLVGGSHGRPITVTVERGGRTVTLGRAVRSRSTAGGSGALLQRRSWSPVRWAPAPGSRSATAGGSSPARWPACATSSTVTGAPRSRDQWGSYARRPNTSRSGSSGT
jgi:regulator of sigma E protease